MSGSAIGVTAFEDAADLHDRFAIAGRKTFDEQQVPAAPEDIRSSLHPATESGGCEEHGRQRNCWSEAVIILVQEARDRREEKVGERH